MEGILIPLYFFGSVFGITYLYLTTRNRERMALIEKGLGADIFNKKNSNILAKISLKLGMFIMGIGLGVLAGHLLNNAGLDDEVAYPSAICFFAGGALILYYVFISRKEKNSLR